LQKVDDGVSIKLMDLPDWNRAPLRDMDEQSRTLAGAYTVRLLAAAEKVEKKFKDLGAAGAPDCRFLFASEKVLGIVDP
jgi:hypothetical protein